MTEIKKVFGGTMQLYTKMNIYEQRSAAARAN